MSFLRFLDESEAPEELAGVRSEGGDTDSLVEAGELSEGNVSTGKGGVLEVPAKYTKFGETSGKITRTSPKKSLKQTRREG